MSALGFNLKKSARKLAIDIGSNNTVIFDNGKVVLDEPSIISTNIKTGEIIVGSEALSMEGRSPLGISTIKPIKSGIIADYYAARQMMSAFLQKAIQRENFTSFRLHKVIVGVPHWAMELEKRAILDSLRYSGARDIYLIEQTLATALGLGIDISAPKANMLVDIGGGITEISVIGGGRIIDSSITHAAGNEVDADIILYLKERHGIDIGRASAEEVKINVGSALSSLPENQAPGAYLTKGRESAAGIPAEAYITYPEIADCIDNTISQIEIEIFNVLRRIPFELYSDIEKNGIWLTGGGSLLRGIAQRFSEKIGIEFHVVEDPLKAVARGSCHADLKSPSMFLRMVSPKT